MPDWSLLSKHGLVLLALKQDPQPRVSDLARTLGLSPRTTQRILNDLVDAGFIVRTREGRRNHYRINGETRVAHPLAASATTDELLEALSDPVRRMPS